MRAWQIHETGGIDAYVLNEVDEPEPGPGEIRIDISHSALNHLDLWVSQGLPAPKHFPHTGGADAAGTVDAIGEGVTGFELGDEIIVDPSLSCGNCALCRNDDIVYCDRFAILGEHVPGTFTDKIVIPTINALRKPGAFAWDVAGSFGLTTSTALRMLERAHLRPEQRLLVVGIGGGVSTAAMVLGRAFRAEIYVTSRSEAKRQWALDNGASAAFDSASEYGKELADLGGVDVVVETVGPATMRQSLRAARPGGKIAICGATSGAKMELTLPHLFFRQLEMIGSSMATHAQFARAATWLTQSEMAFPISRVFGFEELPDALRFFEAADHLGKVALDHSA